MTKEIALIFFAITLSCASQAGIVEQTEIAEGYGANKELALRDALSKAIGQATGIKISTESKMITSQIQSDIEVNSDTLHRSKITVEQSDASELKTDGNIKSYRVLSTRKDDDNFYVVKVSAVIYKFKKDASSSRKRIALMPTRIYQAEYDLYRRYSGDQVKEMVANAVERYLVQSRKFAVLTRSDLAAMGSEMALISSDATPAAEKARLGQVLGSDYILIPELVSAEAAYTEHRTEVTGQMKWWFEGDISVLMRVIATATGEIKFSEKYSVSANLFEGAEDALAFLCSTGVKDLVDRIYPIRLVSVNGDEVILNAGGNSVRPGTHYTVFREGEKLTDPYTGESLGAQEVAVGEIVVTRVEPKLSYAQVLTGESLSSGLVLRENIAADVSNSEPEPIKHNHSGFKAPWD